MLKLDIGELEEWDVDACEGGTYRSDSSISGEKRSRLSNKLSKLSLWLFIEEINSVVVDWRVQL